MGIIDATGATMAQYAYDPYGTTRAAIAGSGSTAATITTNNPLRYIGGYQDTETGLYKLGARYYNPTTGRFTTPDPSGQESNAYLYAAASPTNGVDPNGLYVIGVNVSFRNGYWFIICESITFNALDGTASVSTGGGFGGGKRLSVSVIAGGTTAGPYTALPS